MTSPLLNIDRQRIRQCFNRSALTYDNHSAMQQAIGQKLIAELRAHIQPDKIIDLGCGSGIVTEQVARHCQPKVFHALDIADQLLSLAEKRLAPYGVQVHEEDFNILSSKDILFDCVFSNMSLQWSISLEQVLDAIRRNLASHGVLAFSIPLEGTFSQLQHRSRNRFHDANFILELLKKSGFKLLEHNTEDYHFHFDSWLSAYKTIKKVGANYVFQQTHKSLRGKASLHEVLNTAQLVNSAAVLNYHIGFFVFCVA